MRQKSNSFQGVHHGDNAELNGATLVHKAEKLQPWWLVNTNGLTLNQYSSTADSYNSG